MSGPAPTTDDRPADRGRDVRTDRTRVLLAGVLIAATLIAVALLSLREIVGRPPPLAIVLPTATPPPVQAMVHMAGAVAAPGVYLLAPDTRLHAAIEAAGGATVDADLDAVNLAAPVQDGRRYYIPTKGAASVLGSGDTPSLGALVDLNTATLADLDALPGIGPSLAEAIVRFRQENGPFATVEDLDAVPGIGATTVERLRPYVTVS